MSEEVVVVVAGGEAPRADALLGVPPGAPVIAADGGLEHARALGLEVRTVVGDFDSVGEAALNGAVAAGTRAVRYPAEKDATDLELALDAALELRPERVVVLASGGGRLDHLFANLLLLASPRYTSVAVDADFGAARVHVIRRQRLLAGKPGEPVSLLAVHGAAEGVWTDGLVYPLASETLAPGSSRGVSNLFASETASIGLERGVLLVVRPGPVDKGAK